MRVYEHKRDQVRKQLDGLLEEASVVEHQICEQQQKAEVIQTKKE